MQVKEKMMVMVRVRQQLKQKSETGLDLCFCEWQHFGTVTAWLSLGKDQFGLK